MQSEPIDDGPDFRSLEVHADAVLSARGYRRLLGKGSTSWIDPRSGPPPRRDPLHAVQRPEWHVRRAG